MLPVDRQPTWRIDRAAECARVVLGGDWFAKSGRIPGFPASALGDLAAGTALRFDVTVLRQWDSGLIVFPWDAKRAAATAGLALDVGVLPNQPSSCWRSCRMRSPGPASLSWIVFGR